ncbi:MAG: hypothetical protein P8M72_04005 [Gammaproteobacteria bacterium]|nr:hypothetical protein [Gammaproteobacteria bacterium]
MNTWIGGENYSLAVQLSPPKLFPIDREKGETMKIITTVCIFLLLQIWTTHAALAEAPSFRGGLLTLPVVEDRDDTLTLELELLDGTFPPEFAVTYSREIRTPVDIDTPYFFNDLLVIPALRLGHDTYWVELRLVGSDLFILDSYGLNRDSVPDYFDGPDYRGWVRVPGEARDIGVGADGTVWVLGGNPYPDTDFDFFDDNVGDADYGLWVLDEFGWLEIPGSGVRLDVDPDGYPWVINSDHEIWRLTPFGWDHIPGSAHDIGIGADGSVWVLGTTERRGGYEIFRYTGFGWQKVHGTGVRIDVDPYGNPWVINHDDDIFHLVNGYWQEVPGLAKDIGIGADGSVWAIGSNEREGGYGIYTWDGFDWIRVRGSARQISVGPDGSPWVVNREREIYTRF